MTQRESVSEMPWLMRAIVVGLVLWGILHAVGASGIFTAANPNPLRAVVILAFCGLFLAWWWWLLRSRRRRLGE